MRINVWNFWGYLVYGGAIASLQGLDVALIGAPWSRLGLFGAGAVATGMAIYALLPYL